MDKKILEKINALLAKTVENGCTVEEATAAARMAQRLIAKHHIDLRECGQTEDVGSCEEWVSKPWQHSLATVIAQNTCCEVINTQMGRSRKRLTFVGRDTDRVAVLKLYDKLSMICQRGLAKEKARHRELYGTTRGVENDYCYGFIKAVREAMNEQCRALALVVPTEVTDKFHQMFPHQSKSRQVTIRMGASYRQGYADGKDATGQKRLNGHQLAVI